MTIRVVTNNVPRDVIQALELTSEECMSFGYLDWKAIEADNDNAFFVRYKDELYCLNDFSSDWGFAKGTDLPEDLKAWHAFISDSPSSGIVAKWSDEGDQIVMGTFYVS